MELKDFVARTLVEISEGVRAAQEATRNLDVRINPFRGQAPGRSREIIHVEFNVAISETEGTATSGRIGVMAGLIGATSSGQSTSGNSAATSIRFLVPMILPAESDTSKHPDRLVGTVLPTTD